MTGPAAPIGEVRAAAFTVPTDRPEADGTLAWDSTTMVTCEIEAGGETGFGYTYAAPATARFIAETLAPVLEGRNSCDTAARWRDMVGAVRNNGVAGVAAMAISACDAALHDLRARRMGVPLSEAIGAARDKVPLYASGGFTTYSIDELVEQIGTWTEDGFTSMKVKVGADPGIERERLTNARRAAGPQVDLMIDANGACSRKQALRLAEVAADLQVRWFEEPVSSDDLEGLRLLRNYAPVGLEIAAGEYGFDAFHFRQLCEAGAVDVLQADATRCLGITGLLQVDALAWAANLPLSLHCAPALHLQPALCLQRLRHVEWFHDHVRVEAMLLDGAPTASAGSVQGQPDRPGLGLRLKNSDAEKFQVVSCP